MSAPQWPEWEEMMKDAMAKEKESFDKWKDGDKGIPEGKILEAYEEIIRRAYLDKGHCTEADIQKYKGMMDNKLKGELKAFMDDGYMDFKEFQIMMMKDKHGYVMEMFKEYDLNNDGTITQAEMTEIISTLETNNNQIHAQKMKEFFSFMLKNCDQDGDGNIDKQEFLEGTSQWFFSKIEVPTNFHHQN